MKALFRQFAALAISAGLACPTFAENPDDPSPFDPAKVLSSPAPEATDLLAFDMNRIVTQQLRIVRYQATEYQRKVAAQRARAYVAAQRRAIAQAKASQKSATTPKTAKSTTSPKSNKTTVKTTPPEPQDEPVAEPKKVAKNIGVDPKPLPRYLAVDTVKDKRASPKAKKVVMVWDTRAEDFVGNNIYDVENPPAIGATAKFETYAAEYIGTGL